jgi:IMP dehydrogenase
VSALTFDDISVIPRYSDVLPSEVDTSIRLTPNIKLNIPILSAAMDTVTMAPLAIALAQLGGMGVIHKNLSVAEQVAEVKKVKRFGGGIVKSPFTVAPDVTLASVKDLIRDTGYHSFPVVKDDLLVGLITARDIKFERNEFALVGNVMTKLSNLVVATTDMTSVEMVEMMYAYKVERLPVVSHSDRGLILEGMVTLKDVTLLDSFPNAIFDSTGCLVVAAAIGVNPREKIRAEKLVEAGANALVIDTAHGHSKGVLEMVCWARQEFPWTGIIAGNVVTSEGVDALYDHGAHCVKVGIGPGSICTTRVVTGVGVPQFTAIQNCAANCNDLAIIADGGIRYSGDIFKAFVAGADAVMLGGLLAGTDEAPGEIELYQGRSYKHYRGMGSLSAMTQPYGSGDRYRQVGVQSDKLVPEGIEGRVPCRGPLSGVIHQLVGGLRSGMGYVGARKLDEIGVFAEYVEISNSSVLESHPHDVTITREAPNYSGGHC